MKNIIETRVVASRYPDGAAVRVRPAGGGARIITVTTVGPKGGVNTMSIVLTGAEVAALAEALNGAA
jgi:hypothetical protein